MTFERNSITFSLHDSMVMLYYSADLTVRVFKESAHRIMSKSCPVTASLPQLALTHRDEKGKNFTFKPVKVADPDSHLSEIFNEVIFLIKSALSCFCSVFDLDILVISRAVGQSKFLTLGMQARVW